MAKPEWGVKRQCANCATRFYDLLRDPITCPECGTVFEVAALVRGKRTRPAASRADVVKKPVVDEAEDLEIDVDLDEDDSVDDDESVVLDDDESDDVVVPGPAASDDAGDDDDTIEGDDTVLLDDDDDDLDDETLGDFDADADEDDVRR